MTARRPKVRTELTVVELDGEAVVYDEESMDVHRFNPSATVILGLLDGRATVEELAVDISDVFGQRREDVAREGSGLRLVAAEPRAWLPSFTARGDAVPLACHLSSFSQPGPGINQALLAAGGRLLDAAGIGRLAWQEWGAGYGNLTAWLADRLGPAGVAVESDPGAVELLRSNAARFFPDVVVRRGVAGRPPGEPAAGPPVALWAIDPPRPGFPALLRTLPARADRPAFVLAWHCHERGRAADAAELRSARYGLVDWIAVDAYPGTPHLETVSLWRKNSNGAG